MLKTYSYNYFLTINLIDHLTDFHYLLIYLSTYLLIYLPTHLLLFEIID